MSVRPFPRVFRVAILLEVLERLAYYGAYINLAVYLLESVHLGEAETGLLLGWFAAARSWLPIATGPFSDRFGFRRSLTLCFALYAFAYAALVLFPSRVGAWSAVTGMGVAGAFLKPVIPASVRRYSPEGREALGFSIFYASVNAGSVVGKVGAKLVRTAMSLRASFVNSVVASVVALGVTLAMFREPVEAAEVHGPEGPEAPPRPSFGASLRVAGRDLRFVGFLVLVSGYYLLIEQFYQTFPVYAVRQLGADVPREYITLINPAAIALFQLPVARLTRRLPALVAMPVGIGIGACSMLLMGAWPTLLGACASFFVFAIGEMVYSPRYYEYALSFAPRGREGMYMGLALVPFGLGGLAGGVLSGRLIGAYLPKGGTLHPLSVWGTYSAIGLVCAAALGLFGAWARGRPAPAT